MFVETSCIYGINKPKLQFPLKKISDDTFLPNIPKNMIMTWISFCKHPSISKLTVAGALSTQSLSPGFSQPTEGLYLMTLQGTVVWYHLVDVQRLNGDYDIMLSWLLWYTW